MAQPPETFLPTPWEGYIMTDGKLLLHRMWVSLQGAIEWRKVPIVQPFKMERIENPLYREIMQHAPRETQVFNDHEWGDDGNIRPMSQILPGD